MNSKKNSDLYKEEFVIVVITQEGRIYKEKCDISEISAIFNKYYNDYEIKDIYMEIDGCGVKIKVNLATNIPF